jgi:hypothetical protein
VRILVGGESRKCGKTSLVCRILAWFPERAWVAVKVSEHRHETPHPTGGDTARYLAAGARNATLIEAAGEDAARQVEEWIDGAEAACVETTSAAQWLTADVRLMVRANGTPPKPAAAAERFRPDAFVGAPRREDPAPCFPPGSEELREYLVKRWKEKRDL